MGGLWPIAGAAQQVAPHLAADQQLVGLGPEGTCPTEQATSEGTQLVAIPAGPFLKVPPKGSWKSSDN